MGLHCFYMHPSLCCCLLTCVHFALQYLQSSGRRECSMTGTMAACAPSPTRRAIMRPTSILLVRPRQMVLFTIVDMSSTTSRSRSNTVSTRDSLPVWQQCRCLRTARRRCPGCCTAAGAMSTGCFRWRTPGHWSGRRCAAAVHLVWMNRQSAVVALPGRAVPACFKSSTCLISNNGNSVFCVQLP